MISKSDYNSQVTNRLKKLEEKIDEINLTVNEIKSNIRTYNQFERQLIKEIESKLFLQLKSQFDEIHYLQYNLQKTQQSTENVDKILSDIKTKFDENLLTKDDLKIIESFLRFIAANQMIQETYLNITEN